MTISNVVRDYIVANPTQLVGRLDYENQALWVKRRPESKRKIWHHLLHYLTYIIPLPIIYPTALTDIANALLNEAARYRLFAEHDITVPAVLDVQQEYLVTTDVGGMVQDYLAKLTEPRDKYHLLNLAVMTLSRLHQAGLCHGRPSLRDLTYFKGKIYFIDLEEEPLNVMSLPQAQARDLWLFLNSVARHCKQEPELLNDLFISYLSNAQSETITALKQMVLFLRPVRCFVEYGLLRAINSRDLRSAVQINKVLEQHFIRAH